MIPDKGAWVFVRSWLNAEQELSWGWTCGAVPAMSEAEAWLEVSRHDVRARADEALLKAWDYGRIVN